MQWAEVRDQRNGWAHSGQRETRIKLSQNIQLLSSTCCSVTQSCLTLCDSMDCSTPGFPVLHYLLEFSQPHVHWVGDAIQPFCPLLSPSLSAFNFSQHQSLFQCPALCNRWPKNWGFSLSISPSNESSGLISFRMYWLDLLAVLGIFSNTTVRKYQFFGT